VAEKLDKVFRPLSAFRAVRPREKRARTDRAIPLHKAAQGRVSGAFAPLREALLTLEDHYLRLADLKSYKADHKLTALYADGDAYASKAILNIANSGKFWSNRTTPNTPPRSGMPCPVP